MWKQFSPLFFKRISMETPAILFTCENAHNRKKNLKHKTPSMTKKYKKGKLLKKKYIFFSIISRLTCV